jgi:hypothetical protein
MSRRLNRSAVLGGRGPKERQRLGLPPRQLRELMDPSGEATAAGGRPSRRPAVRQRRPIMRHPMRL